MILSNPFNQDQFYSFINNFLPDFQKNEQSVNVGKSGFQKILKLGESISLSTSVIVIRGTRNLSSRVTLTNNTFKILKNYGIYRALVVYLNEDDSVWRLSLLTATPTFDSSGKVIVTYSNPRRHSYVLGTEVGIATARKYLATLGKIRDFDDLKYRFSIEVVNKDFYREIAEHFYELVGRYGDMKEVLKKPALKLPNKKAKIEHLQNYSVRLLGRIIFLWFLKEKTSNTGKPLLPIDLLTSKDGNCKDILHDRIEPIFFEVLNKQFAHRDPKFQRDLYGQVPYLNGGLFHASEGDAGDFYSDKLQKSEIDIPDSWFIALFKTLDTYNFTIDENLENDVDLSIDPEMLGRVFENLLAEINPETGQVARKSTGSYYTPRAIVNFMVDETLTEYLLSKTLIEEDKIRAVITTSKHDDAEHPLSDLEKLKIVKAISELQVLDPACGSGAFPIGMLQKLLWVITQVDPEGNEYLESQDLEGTEHWLTSGRLDYLRKRKIIRDVIFGTDIQSVAVEIAKLRCFLTLIVDQEIDDISPNRGVVPLPNLDFKFICADSLIPLDTNKQLALGDDPDLENKLASIRRRYFTTNNEEKKTKLRVDFEKLVTTDPKLFAEGKRSTQLKSFRPFASNNQAKFLDLQTMFGTEGFPIIIGNPPYKILVGKESREVLENLKKETFYRFALGGRLNLYRHFIERSQALLSHAGILSFIVPSTLIADQNSQGIRTLLSQSGSLKFIIEFPENEKVFESVTQATTIFLYSKSNNSDSFKLSVGLNKAILPPETSAVLSWKEIRNLFGESLTLPLVKTEEEFHLIKHIYEKSKALGLYADCYQGDINLTFHKANLRDIPTDNLLVRGDHISNYEVNLSLLNTDRRWFDNAGAIPVSKKERIACQQVANMGLRRRLNAAIIPRGVVVANSANCIEVKTTDLSMLTLLGLLNSSLMNWIFKKTSTNNHVNVYELNQLPIKLFATDEENIFNGYVEKIIELKKSVSKTENDLLNISEIESQINRMVYELYSLSTKEIDLIEFYV